MPVKVRPPNRARRSIPAMLPAPVGGLNGRDTYAGMAPTDAFVLDNLFPHNTSVDTRGGTAFHAQIPPGKPVESLEIYTGAQGAQMLAFGGGNIYDVTGGSPPGTMSPVMTSSRVTTAMFSNAGAQWLIVCTGQDQPLGYNGLAWTPLVITGTTGSPNGLHHPYAFKGRLYFAQVAQLGFYYLAVGAIQGAASFFDLGQVSLKGGSLHTITSFSQGDTGTGPQDYMLFVTTEGEYILYAGTDPSNSATWGLIGRYVGPPPIGPKGHFKFRSDVYFITTEGVMSFAQIRQTGEGNAQDSYITAKLGRNYSDVTKFQSTHGWCGMIYPEGGMLIVNVPAAGTLSGEYSQFAMNTDTNAWGRFKGLQALTWVLFSTHAYYGTYDGRVIKFDQGYTDLGFEIHATARQAWNTFDQDRVGNNDKQYHMAQLVLRADGIPTISCIVNVNFQDNKPLTLQSVPPQPGAIWDVALWDMEYWAGSASVTNVQVPIGDIGYVASLWLELGSLTSKVQWIASRILFEPTKRAFI